MTPNDAASLKVIGEIVAALGVPGTLMVVLCWHLIRNKDKAPDTAGTVISRLDEIEEMIEDVKTLIKDTGTARDHRIDTISATTNRIESAVLSRVTHWTDRTIPPAGQP